MRYGNANSRRATLIIPPITRRHSMPAEGLLDSFRVLGRNLEKRFCRTMRVTPPLLPVPKSGHADSDHERKLILRLLELLSNCLYIFRRESKLAARFNLSAQDAPTLTDAIDQLIKVFRIHLNLSAHPIVSGMQPPRPSAQRPRTTSMPESSSSVFAREIFPTRFARTALSRVTTCETFATESFGSPVAPAESSTLPGASAQTRLLVSGTQTTVAILLRFSASPCTITTGLRNPGSDPLGKPRSAHQTSPCEITTPFSPGCAE